MTSMLLNQLRLYILYKFYTYQITIIKIKYIICKSNIIIQLTS